MADTKEQETPAAPAEHAYSADELKAELAIHLTDAGFTVTVGEAKIKPRLVFADRQSLQVHGINEHAYPWECLFRSVPSDGTYLADPAYVDAKFKELIRIFRGITDKTTVDGMTFLVVYRVGDPEYSTILISTAFM